MFDVLGNWSRVTASGAAMDRTSLDAIETLEAAHEVIAARIAIIGLATASPMSEAHGELERIIPEKVTAFSEAGSAVMSTCWAAQTAWMGHLEHLGIMTMRPQIPTALALKELGDTLLIMAVETVEATARLGAGALEPVHRQVVANARRLCKR